MIQPHHLAALLKAVAADLKDNPAAQRICTRLDVAADRIMSDLSVATIDAALDVALDVDLLRCDIDSSGAGPLTRDVAKYGGALLRQAGLPVS